MQHNMKLHLHNLMETVLALSVAATASMNMLGRVGGTTETEREGEIDNAEHGGNRNWRKEGRGGTEGRARMKWPLLLLSSTEKRGGGMETPINDKMDKAKTLLQVPWPLKSTSDVITKVENQNEFLHP